MQLYKIFYFRTFLGFMDKELVFIVSAGRTGTQFFGKLLGEIIDDCVSAHEPDRYAGLTRATWESIRHFGLSHVVIKRFLRKSGIRHLTQQRLSGNVSDDQIIQAIHRHRDQYINRQSASLIIEAYYQWYGLLPCLRSAYPECKVIGIIRDPRTWTMSLLHRNLRHTLGEFAGKLTPGMIQDEVHIGQWSEMGDFERSCWEWKTINRLILTFVDNDPGSRLYRFEDLFEAKDRVDTMRNFLDFTTTFDRRSYSYELSESTMGRRLNASGTEAVKWSEWTVPQARALHSICGDMMCRLGYGQEPAWRDKIGVD